MGYWVLHKNRASTTEYPFTSHQTQYLYNNWHVSFLFWYDWLLCTSFKINIFWVNYFACGACYFISLCTIGNRAVRSHTFILINHGDSQMEAVSWIVLGFITNSLHIPPCPIVMHHHIFMYQAPARWYNHYLFS
jgi:hypothetical protein